MTTSAQLPLRCWAEIDLAALERNLKLIRASLPPGIKYVAVVKADAYGHGLPHIAARLMHAGADLFAVASVAEAMTIRELSADWPVLLLSPVLPEEDRYLAEYSLAATVSSPEEVRRFDAAGRAAGRTVDVHLKIDTGMGRLGVWHTQAVALHAQIQAAPGVRLAGVFTHFACADEDPKFTEEQRRIFLETVRTLPGLDPARLFVHADNSAGLETTPGRGVFNAVRVGLLQFGILPHPNSLLARVRTEPVFSFHTRVGLVKELPAGTGISYGRTHVVSRATRYGRAHRRLRRRSRPRLQQPRLRADWRTPLSHPRPRLHGPDHRRCQRGARRSPQRQSSRARRPAGFGRNWRDRIQPLGGYNPVGDAMFGDEARPATLPQRHRRLARLKPARRANVSTFASGNPVRAIMTESFTSLSPAVAWQTLPATRWDEAAARHLLQRIGFSARPEAVARTLRDGPIASVERCFAQMPAFPKRESGREPRSRSARHDAARPKQ